MLKLLIVHFFYAKQNLFVTNRRMEMISSRKKAIITHWVRAINTAGDGPASAPASVVVG